MISEIVVEDDRSMKRFDHSSASSYQYSVKVDPAFVVLGAVVPAM